MSYTTASNKSDRDLVSYQSVRGAETKEIYGEILEATPVSEVHSNFVKPAKNENTKAVDDTIQFLQSTDFLDRPSERTIEPIHGQPFEDLSFELRMFHHLMQQDRPQDHFMRVHQVIVDGDTAFYDKEDLLEDVKRELGSYPFDWNIQKIQNWYNLMAPFGLVSVRDNQEILTSPSPAILYELLAEFQKAKDSNQVRSALDWIEQNFFPCYTNGGAIPRIHRGLSDTFGTLMADDVLDLGAPSDASQEVKIPASDANQVSNFTLEERPNQPAYQYPLDAHTARPSQ